MVLLLLTLSARLVAASPLSDLATQMMPGTWEELSTSGLWDGIHTDGGSSHHIVTYSHGGVWDPAGGQAFFIGGDHNERQAFVRYDEATNVWSEPPRPWFLSDMAQRHSYSMNTIDLDNRFYFYATERYDIETGVWDSLPEDGFDGSAGAGNHGFAYLSGLGLLHTSYVVQTMADGASSWVTRDGDPGYSTLHHFSEYLPVHDKVLYGGGDGSTQLYTIDADGLIEALPDTTPASMTQITTRPYNSLIGDGTLVTHHPTTGDLLVITAEGGMWSYDLQSWTQLGELDFLSKATNSALDDSMLISIGSLGVVIMVEWISETPGDARMWVYKPVDAQIDQLAPAAPSNLAVE